MELLGLVAEERKRGDGLEGISPEVPCVGTSSLGEEGHQVVREDLRGGGRG